MSKKGVTVSIGHSSGRLVDGEKAFHAGATAITHLFNAMNSVKILLSIEANFSELFYH